LQLFIPIGVQNNHDGVIDIIERKALYFLGSNGEEIEESPVPERMVQLMEEKRTLLIESLAEIDDEVAEKYVTGEEIQVDDLKAAIRRATLSNKFIPVFMGSAVKNKGVQPLIDGVCDYLPDPTERERIAFSKEADGADEKELILQPDPKLPLVAYAFKLDENKHGQLTWLRIYQGELKKGQIVSNCNVDVKTKVPKLVRMNAGDLEEIESVKAGDICAMFGVDCASGETFSDGTVKCQLTSMHVPEPVISLSIATKSSQHSQQFMKALKRFSREDPTFRVLKDNETQETLIAGMGELHLEIYVERMRREYELAVILGKPRVKFRETITMSKGFDYTHKKQSGGRDNMLRLLESLSQLMIQMSHKQNLLIIFLEIQFHQIIFQQLKKDSMIC